MRLRAERGRREGRRTTCERQARRNVANPPTVVADMQIRLGPRDDTMQIVLFDHWADESTIGFLGCTKLVAVMEPRFGPKRSVGE